MLEDFLCSGCSDVIFKLIDKLVIDLKSKILNMKKDETKKTITIHKRNSESNSNLDLNSLDKNFHNFLKTLLNDLNKRKIVKAKKYLKDILLTKNESNQNSFSLKFKKIENFLKSKNTEKNNLSISTDKRMEDFLNSKNSEKKELFSEKKKLIEKESLSLEKSHIDDLITIIKKDSKNNSFEKIQENFNYFDSNKIRSISKGKYNIEFENIMKNKKKGESQKNEKDRFCVFDKNIFSENTILEQKSEKLNNSNKIKRGSQSSLKLPYNRKKKSFKKLNTNFSKSIFDDK